MLKPKNTLSKLAKLSLALVILCSAIPTEAYEAESRANTLAGYLRTLKSLDWFLDSTNGWIQTLEAEKVQSLRQTIVLNSDIIENELLVPTKSRLQPARPDSSKQTMMLWLSMGQILRETEALITRVNRFHEDAKIFTPESLANHYGIFAPKENLRQEAIHRLQQLNSEVSRSAATLTEWWNSKYYSMHRQELEEIKQRLSQSNTFATTGDLMVLDPQGHGTKSQNFGSQEIQKSLYGAIKSEGRTEELLLSLYALKDVVKASALTGAITPNQFRNLLLNLLKHSDVRVRYEASRMLQSLGLRIPYVAKTEQVSVKQIQQQSSLPALEKCRSLF